MKQLTISEVNDMKAELETQAVFAELLAKELSDILSRSKNGKVNKYDVKRVREIEEILEEKKKWVATLQAQVREFYKPAFI